MVNKVISFLIENETKVKPAIRMYASGYQFLVNKGDVDSYEVTFNTPTHYKMFLKLTTGLLIP